MITEGGEQICQDLMEAVRKGWDRGPEAVLVPAHPAQEQRLVHRCVELDAAACRGAAVADDYGAAVEGGAFSASAEDFSEPSV